MKTHFAKVPLLILAASLLFAIFLILTCKHNQRIEAVVKHKNSIETNLSEANYEALFSKTIIPNRLPLFIHALNQKDAYLKNVSDFQIKAQDSFYRQQLAHQTRIDANWILLHLELADLSNSGLSEVDAQILHFAHSNYQNLFTGETFNSNVLATADPESILMNIQGWQAGNWDPIVQEYIVDLKTIEQWIRNCQHTTHNPAFSSPILEIIL